jgi:Domain of unknown function (DUF4326)
MSSAPHIVMLSRKAGWRMPKDTVKVARPTMWGNPYAVGMERIPDAATAVAAYRWWVGSADWDAWLYSHHFSAWHETQGLRGEQKLSVHLEKLRGKNLACWCKAGEPCHAAVLLELANKEVGHE